MTSINVTHEPYGTMSKWHLNHSDWDSPALPADCRPVIHQLGVDDGLPHDHPFDFFTFFLRGGYEEEVFEQYRPRTAWGEGDDLLWRSSRRQLRPGQSRYVPAGTVHRVTALLDGPCFTCVLYGPQEREWRYYPEALA